MQPPCQTIERPKKALTTEDTEEKQNETFSHSTPTEKPGERYISAHGYNANASPPPRALISPATVARRLRPVSALSFCAEANCRKRTPSSSLILMEDIEIREG
jgi:hypothetical protein